jgi:hypothetical protein
MSKTLQHGATVPRRSALWVQERHHQIVKLCSARLGYTNLYQFVEEAIEAYTRDLGLDSSLEALKLFDDDSEQSEGDGEGVEENVS